MLKDMTREELEKRMSEIVESLDDEEADLDALEEEAKEIKEEIEERNSIETKKADIRSKVALGEGTVVRTFVEEETPKMTNNEIRNSAEYLEAFANYIKTGKDEEVRALLTENVDGVVPVPEIAEQRVREAWESDKVFSRVMKTFVRGNLKVGFELSATDAEVHVEGTDAPAEETLVLGIVTMIPSTIKKWITFSTEANAMGAEDFIRYIYDELTYKIIQKAADEVIAAIKSAPTESTKTAVGIAQIEGAVTPETILAAIAELGDNARDNVIIASGATIAAVRSAALSANFGYDPFFGLEVIQKEGVTGAIIGDLSGVQANLPEGESVKFVYDEFSLAEKDLIKLVGRLYVAIAVVAPKMLAVITGGADSE